MVKVSRMSLIVSNLSDWAHNACTSVATVD
jgi:hypothetical protein